MRIYLISATGCAYTGSRKTAIQLCKMCGFRRCSKSEYNAKMDQVLKADKPVAAVGRFERRGN